MGASAPFSFSMVADWEIIEEWERWSDKDDLIGFYLFISSDDLFGPWWPKADQNQNPFSYTKKLIRGRR